MYDAGDEKKPEGAEDDIDELPEPKSKGVPVNPLLIRLWNIVNDAVTAKDYILLNDLKELPPSYVIDGYKFAALWAGGGTSFEAEAVKDFIAAVEQLHGIATKGAPRRAKAYVSALNLTSKNYGEYLGRVCKAKLAEIGQSRRPKPQKEFVAVPLKTKPALAATQKRLGPKRKPVLVVGPDEVVVKRPPGGRPPRNQRPAPAVTA